MSGSAQGRVVKELSVSMGQRHEPARLFPPPISVHFPNDYPFKPPKMKFVTPVFHLNVYDAPGRGRPQDICLDILDDKWSPALTTGKVLQSIQSLFMDPNQRSPASR
eukprot:gene29104-56674_t